MLDFRWYQDDPVLGKSDYLPVMGKLIYWVLYQKSKVSLFAMGDKGP